MARKISKASKRRLVFLGPLSIIIIIYFIFTVGIYGYKLISLYKSEQELKVKLVSLQAEEDDLKIEIQKLKDPDYLARYAREKYLYSKDGEYIIKIDNSEYVEDNTEKEDTTYQYILYASVFIILLVLVYIVIKGIKK